MEHVKFGIYHDAALKDVVNEADVGYNEGEGGLGVFFENYIKYEYQRKK